VDKESIPNSYVDIVEMVYNLFVHGFTDDVISVFERLKLNLMKNQLNSIMWCMRMFEFYESLKNTLISENLEKFIYNPFSNRTFTFEGTFIKFNLDDVCKMIKSLGGNVANRINEKINYLVLSNDKYFEYHNGKKSSKMLKVFKLISDENNIKVISENVMVKLISNYERENHVKVL
jgi:NAD-dependent DNA ligase